MKFKKSLSLLLLTSILITTLFSYPIFADEVEIVITAEKDEAIEGNGCFCVAEEGEIELSVTTNPSGLDVDWYCGNSNVELHDVEVNDVIDDNRKIVEGLKAGTATIIATVYSGGNEYTAECTVYVYKPNGVYYIKNLNSNYYLNVENGGVYNGTNVNLKQKLSSSSSDPNKARQMWITQYLGEGLYSIRPLHKPNMGLNVSSNNVNIYDIGYNDSTNIATSAQWLISDFGTGYLITNNGQSPAVNPRYLTMQAENASTAEGANVVATTYVNNNNCRWVFEEVSDVPSGVYLYDTIKHQVVSNPTIYVSPGETITLESLGWQAVMFSPTYRSQTLNWTPNDESLVTVHPKLGTVTGVSAGSTTIIVRSGYLPNKPLYVNLNITDFANGTYYINNKENGQFVSLGNPTNVTTPGTTIYQWSFKDVASERWIFNHIGEGYYSIKSARSDGNYYLGVSGDSSSSGASIVYRTSSATDGTKWRIEATSNNAYKLIPKCGENNNLVLSTTTGSDADEYTLKQSSYMNNDSYRDEWRIIGSIQSTLITLLPEIGEGSYDSIPDSLKDMGEGAYRSQGNVSKSDCLNYLQNSEVFIIMSHGWKTLVALDEQQTSSLTIQDIEGLDDNALSGSKLVFYGACSAGRGTTDTDNLVDVTHAKGAETVIGFEKDVWIEELQIWSAAFFESLSTGDTIQEAAEYADDVVRDEAENRMNYMDQDQEGFVGPGSITTDSWVIAGSTTQTFS